MMGADPSIGPSAAGAAAGVERLGEQQARAATPPPPPAGTPGVKQQSRAMSDDGVVGSNSGGGGGSNGGGGASPGQALKGDRAGIRPRAVVTNWQPNTGQNNSGASALSVGATGMGGRPDSPSNGSSGSGGGGDGSNTNSSRGVIPRICDFLFERAEAATTKANNANANAAGTAVIGSPSASHAVPGKRSGVSTRWVFR